jgi:hypothetical protein
MIKSRSMRWVRHVAHMADIIYAPRKELGNMNGGYEDINKETGWEGVAWFPLAQDRDQ